MGSDKVRSINTETLRIRKCQVRCGPGTRYECIWVPSLGGMEHVRAVKPEVGGESGV